MEDEENEPRSLLSEVLPTPMPKSSLPCGTGDPLLSLTPEKPTRPLGTSNQGRVRVERHIPTSVVSNGRTSGVSNRDTDHRSSSSNKNNHGLKTIKSRNSADMKDRVARNKGNRQNQKSVRIAEPCKLSEPQCHTTALVEKHLEVLERQEFSGDSAVMKALEESETVRTAFAERVAEGVNRPIDERKYSGRIGLKNLKRL